MEINLEKEFLGQPPIKVHRTSFREETSHGINSINGYCRHRSEPVVNQNLDIIEAACVGISGARSIEMPTAHYYPVDIRSFIRYSLASVSKKLAFSRNHTEYGWDNVIFINGLSRPNTEHIFNKFSQILKEEFPNSYHVESGRYVFCMDHISPLYINSLLNIAKTGDGSVIDYTWIAPLQDVIEYYEDIATKDRLKKKSLKKRMRNDRAGIPLDTEEVYLPPIPKEWGFATSGRTVASSTKQFNTQEEAMAYRAEKERNELIRESLRREKLEKLKSKIRSSAIKSNTKPAEWQINVVANTVATTIYK